MNREGRAGSPLPAEHVPAPGGAQRSARPTTCTGSWSQCTVREPWRLPGLALAVFVFVFVFLAAVGSGAADKPVTANEYALKSVFLLNFTKFIEWPAHAFTHATAPFVVGVVGEDPFGGTLRAVFAGQTVGGHPIVVRRDPPPGASGSECHLLFFSHSDPARHNGLLAGLPRRPTLTVGEADRFLEEGGMINLVVVNERIRVQVNLRAAEQAGLKISSKLLGVATRVVGTERQN